ncbi:alpha carbonic anhydrase [Syncephalis fuscata]|nr:alpha carbonic anhydrase [Syncephalis fuscata]
MRALLLTLTFASATLAATVSDSTWSYDGATGPAYWSRLSSGNKACGEGQHQSPINLMKDTAKLYKFNEQYGPLLTFNWTSTGTVDVVHNGHALQVDLGSDSQKKNTLNFNNVGYEMQQFHVHTPSEHRIDGKHYDGEVHFVSKSATGQLLVVGIFLIEETYKDNSVLAPITQKLPLKPQERVSNITIDLSTLSSVSDGFWTYSGSLTTPPCTEGVTWVVFDTAMPVSVNQLHVLTNTNHFNARYTMPAHEH